MNDDTIYIGHRHGWGSDSLFGIRAEDARHHTYIIGKTGTGKTTLLRNMIFQHLYNGSGLALLDPHGDLAEELLDHFPPSRADDLVYFNPGDLEFPIGLNLLANVPKDSRHLVASGIVAAFKSIWRDSWGPRMEYILYNAFAALLDCQNTSLLGVNRMLTDADYRAWVVRQIEDPFVRGFWADEFAGYDARFVREAIAPIQNKIGQFLMNPPIRNILGQVKSKIDFRFMMDTGRVLSQICQKENSEQTRPICSARCSPHSFNWPLCRAPTRRRRRDATFICSSTSSTTSPRIVLLPFLRKRENIGSV